MYACILIRAVDGRVAKVLESVKGIKGVVKAFSVYGRYDIVAFAEAPDFDSVAGISREINAVKGVKSTETAVEA